jgi:nucleoside-diphosphate-sugar epimerase
MKILVAGGCGYVGSVLVPKLIDYGYDVTVIDLEWFGNYFSEGVKVIRKDLFKCCEKDFEGFDVCINLSGISNDPGAEFDPARNFIYNAALSPYLALMAKRAGVKRFIQASTASVYGYTKNDLKKESDPISCNYPYGVSKFAGESGVIHLNDENFSTIIIRKGTVGGYSSRMRFDLIVNTMTMNALTLKTITINNPAIWRPIVSVNDAATAYVRAVQVDASVSGIFNIAENNYVVGDIADIVRATVERRTGEKVSMIVKNVQDIRNYKIDTSRAEKILGFHAREGVRETTENVLDNWSKLSGCYGDSRFYNIDISREIFKSEVVL